MEFHYRSIWSESLKNISLAETQPTAWHASIVLIAKKINLLLLAVKAELFAQVAPAEEWPIPQNI